MEIYEVKLRLLKTSYLILISDAAEREISRDETRLRNTCCLRFSRLVLAFLGLIPFFRESFVRCWLNSLISAEKRLEIHSNKRPNISDFFTRNSSSFAFNVFYYLLIMIWKDIGFIWKMTFGIFLKSLRFEILWVQKNSFCLKMYIFLCNSKKYYWKSKIQFFSQKMWNTKKRTRGHFL